MKHPNVAITNSVWAAIAKGDPSLALASIAEDVRLENGPGRVLNGRDELMHLLLNVNDAFGDSLRRTGRCLYANGEFSVTLVNETGVHAASGDAFDNRALYVARYGPDGLINRMWTVELDSESVEAFWEQNPLAQA